MRAMSENWQISSRLFSKARSHAAKGKSAGCRAVWVCACLLVVCFSAANAQIRVPSRGAPPPPEPQPLEIKVRRGATAQITLRVYGATNQQVRFRLKTKPALGTISDPEPVSPGTAVVTYEHSGKPEPTRDHFTYIAQSGAGFSAPAGVSITIVDDPPILAAPTEVDFGMAQPGESVEREISIENRGGSVLEGRLAPPEGWKIAGDPAYRLDRGDKQKFTLVFTPEAERMYRGELHFSGSPDRVTLLRGEGAEAFALRPATLDLTAKSDSTIRSGALAIENRTKQAQFARIEAGPRLRISQDRIEVPAGEKIPITVEATPDDPSAFSDKVTAAIGETQLTAEVRAPAIGPVVRTSASKVSLGSVEIGTVGSASLQIENLGGSPVQVQVAAPSPFSVAKEDESFALDAGGKRGVHILFRPLYTGKTASTLSIQGAGRELKIPLDAEGATRAASNESGSSSAPAPPPAPGQLPPWRGSFITANAQQPTGANRLALQAMPYVRVSWQSVSPREAQFEWAARDPKTEQRELRLEVQRLSLDDKRELKVEWLPVGNAEIKQSPGAMSAHLKKLTPNTLYTYRLVPVSAQGEAAEPLGFFELHTPPASRLLSARSLMVLGLFAVLAVLVWKRFGPRRDER
jgi:hypothetical protein